MINTNATLLVKDMHDGEAARKVAESLLGVEGVDDVEVDMEQNRVRVELDEHEPANQEDLVKAVDEAGFVVDRIEMMDVP